MHKGTSLRGRRLLLLLLPVLATAAMFFANAASAATTADGQTSATLSSSNTSVEFVGETKVTNFLPPDPITNSPCPSQAADPANAVCEHFTLNVTQAGTVNVCVQYDTGLTGMNDEDVYIVGPGGVVVASGTTSNNPECVSFAVTSSTTGLYEVQVNPSFNEGPTGIDGKVTFTPQPVAQPSCFKFYGHYEQGSGRTHYASDDDDAHRGYYSYKSNRDDEHGSKYGSFRYRNDSEHYNFTSTRVDSLQYQQIGTNPLGGAIWKLTATGAGYNNGQPVTFTITSIASGMQGVGDTFTIQTSDNQVGGGQIASGQNSYHYYG